MGPELRRIAAGRVWRIVATLAGAALGVQLWGLYRVVGPPTPPWFPNADKLEHAVGFALPVALILLTVWLRGRARGVPFRRSVIIVVAGVFVGHAVVSELIQHFFYVTRTGDPLDALADSLGVAIGVLVFLFVRRRVAGTGRP